MIKYSILSDKELLLNAMENNNCLSELSIRYHQLLSNFVRKFVNDKETSEDIVQETFLRCMHHREKYPDIKNLSTWLFTISANLARTELRRRKRWHSISIYTEKGAENTKFFEPFSNDPPPDAQVSEEQVQSIVRKSIAKLPCEFREVILLRDISGCSYKEISKIFGVPIGTIKSRVNRGRTRLQRLLQDLAEEIIDSRVVPNS